MATRPLGVEGRLASFTHISVLIVALLMTGMARAQTPAAAPAKPIRMVVLGDSLSAGYGLQAPAAFPVRLQKSWNPRG